MWGVRGWGACGGQEGCGRRVVWWVMSGAETAAECRVGAGWASCGRHGAAHRCSEHMRLQQDTVDIFVDAASLLWVVGLRPPPRSADKARQLAAPPPINDEQVRGAALRRCPGRGGGRAHRRWLGGHPPGQTRRRSLPPPRLCQARRPCDTHTHTHAEWCPALTEWCPACATHTLSSAPPALTEVVPAGTALYASARQRSARRPPKRCSVAPSTCRALSCSGTTPSPLLVSTPLQRARMLSGAPCVTGREERGGGGEGQAGPAQSTHACHIRWWAVVVSHVYAAVAPWRALARRQPHHTGEPPPPPPPPPHSLPPYIHGPRDPARRKAHEASQRAPASRGIQCYVLQMAFTLSWECL